MLKEFLTEHRAEVKAMCIEEYNEAETMQLFKEEAFNDGVEKGLKEGEEKGLKKGLQEGEEKGLKKGFEQGDNDRIRKSITRMVTVKGLSYEEACDNLGVNPNDYKDLITV